MSYDKDAWKKRHAERGDMSTFITHLTRDGHVEGKPSNVIEVLFAILKGKRIRGSTTASGFIAGTTPAVCFQDAPPSSLCQNVYYEQKYAEQRGAGHRYSAVGLMFEKPYAYRKGARPAIYDQTNEAKAYLPRSQWWRIVNMDLSDDNSFVDWSHEREWRCPNDFVFDYSEVRVVLTTPVAYKRFLEMCLSDDDCIHLQIAGILVLDAVLR